MHILLVRIYMTLCECKANCKNIGQLSAQEEKKRWGRIFVNTVIAATIGIFAALLVLNHITSNIWAISSQPRNKGDCQSILILRHNVGLGFLFSSSDL